MRRWVAWNVWFRLQEATKGHSTFRILRAMEASDRLPADGLKALQGLQLRAFIDACYRDVPYVRRRMEERRPDHVPSNPPTHKTLQSNPEHPHFQVSPGKPADAE